MKEIQFSPLQSLIPSDWFTHLSSEFNKNYLLNLSQFLDNELNKGKSIYPEKKQIFSALAFTPLKEVKVVIMGQDPYHGPGQAHGLSFSVKKGVKPPPSLVNIFKELQCDLKIEIPPYGELTQWAKQGVLLLNSVLTVEAHKAASHQKKGWELLTDQIVNLLNDQCENLVFLLWGSHAQKKGASIDQKKHLVLQAPHPSPLSAYRGFLDCKHFSKTNEYLKQNHKTPIHWGL